ncbi:MAG: hypothetical protein LAO30_25920 [Acidobacteriia bacterium]|nr:hypothetical protein [Terriglobia bacterium]
MLPAAVNLNQKRIKVAALGAASGIPQDLVLILRTKWVTAIQKDPRFILDERNPETELRFTITNYYVEPRTIAASGQTPACTFYTGKIEASYQAVEVGTDAPLDSENLSYAINEEGTRKSGGFLGGIIPKSNRGGCGTNAMATQNEARDSLIDGIVSEMSQRAAPFEETLTVLVPGGKLEPLSALAVSQRWAKLLEDAEKTDPLPKPDDDAYRLYLVGLANEALAYQDARDAADLEKARRGDVMSDKAKQSLSQEEKDFDEAQAYLDKATKAYKDAMQAKTSEREFRSPDGRMEQAVRLYATINRHKAEYQDAVSKKKTERAALDGNRSRSGGGAGTPASGPASTLSQVIGMCEDHISEIGQLMKDHPSELRFEQSLTVSEELRVRKECGAESRGILDAIKAQLGNKTSAPKK